MLQALQPLKTSVAGSLQQDVHSVQHQEDIKLSVRSWYKEVLERIRHDQPKEPWGKVIGEDGIEVTGLVMKTTVSNCSVATGTTGERRKEAGSTVVADTGCEGQYDLLRELANLKLNINLGQLLALVPKYSAKFSRTLGSDVITGTTIMLDNYRG